MLAANPLTHDPLERFYFLKKETLPNESAKEKDFFSQARKRELVKH
jgi:hypothetical protein